MASRRGQIVLAVFYSMRVLPVRLATVIVNFLSCALLLRITIKQICKKNALVQGKIFRIEFFFRQVIQMQFSLLNTSTLRHHNKCSFPQKKLANIWRSLPPPSVSFSSSFFEEAFATDLFRCVRLFQTRENDASIGAKWPLWGDEDGGGG